MMIIIGALAIVLWSIRRRRRSRSRRLRIAALHALPDTIDVVAAGLRAGCSNSELLRLAARSAPDPLKSNFAAAVRQFDDGARMGEALSWLARTAGPDIEPLVSVLRDGDRLGIPIEERIARLSNDARAARRRLTESSARELPVRLTLPIVSCILPSFVAIVIVPVLVGTLADLRSNF